eukprot:50296-Rhodomonas_salina.6
MAAATLGPGRAPSRPAGRLRLPSPPRASDSLGYDNVVTVSEQWHTTRLARGRSIQITLTLTRLSP